MAEVLIFFCSRLTRHIAFVPGGLSVDGGFLANGVIPVAGHLDVYLRILKVLFRRHYAFGRFRIGLSAQFRILVIVFGLRLLVLNAGFLTLKAGSFVF